MRSAYAAAGLAAAVLLLPAAQAAAAEVTVPMNLISAQGIDKAIGTVILGDSGNGLLIKLDLTNDLPPGAHGFHVHENGSCEPGMRDGTPVAGLAAGGHFDPEGTGRHLGPSGEGHLGDLPILYVGVDEDGATATKHTLVAPRLTVADVRGRSLMIHEKGDNFRDEPEPLGGGGARIACGVIPK